MKKLIQICSFLTLVVAFAVVSVKAQTVQRYEAEIPFDFNVAGKSYAAGTYTMQLSYLRGIKSMTLLDDQKRNLQTFFVMERGDGPSKNPYLRFVRTDDNLSLAKVFTPEKSFSVAGVNAKPKTSKKAGGASVTDSQTVSINLK